MLGGLASIFNMREAARAVSFGPTDYREDHPTLTKSGLDAWLGCMTLNLVRPKVPTDDAVVAHHEAGIGKITNDTLPGCNTPSRSIDHRLDPILPLFFSPFPLGMILQLARLMGSGVARIDAESMVQL